VMTRTQQQTAPALRHQFDFETYRTQVGTEARRIDALLTDADPSTRVPNCPDWTLDDLVHHLGSVYRWVMTVLRTRAAHRLRPATMPDGDWAERRAWLAEGAAELLAELAALGPDTATWAWGTDQRSAFWARRMAYETLVHRADVEQALGLPSRIDAAVATDGIDEFLTNLPHAVVFAPTVRELTGDGETLHWHTTDTTIDDDAEWLITLEPEGFRWSHAHAKGAVGVRGTAADLFLFAWGRLKAEPSPGARLTVFGDRALLAHWVRHAAF
jgi:uncharacterized protein (TIGR03083 family)